VKGGDGDPARKLADRLNTVVILAFGIWSGPCLIFWLQALGILPPFYDAPSRGRALPWFAGCILIGGAMLLLPKAYYRTRRFERGGRVYEKLGVRAFRMVMTNGDWINRRVRQAYPGYCVSAPRDRLETSLRNTLSAEKSHLVLAILGAGAAFYAAAIAWNGWAVWLTVSNLAANVWPILLERYTRARLTSLTERQGRGESRAQARPST
jgi:hypothetical protein